MKAVLFDLDGTLLDTLDDLAASMNAVLAEEGLPTAPAEAHKFMIGDGVLNYVLRALPAGRRGDEALVQRIVRAYRARYAANWANTTCAYDGVDALLDGLGHRGLRLAVLSNKPDGFTRDMVSHFLGRVPFEIVRGATDGVPLKPDPAAALAIAGQMAVDPADFLYLGDTATDMRTARAAGMFAVGALWGFRPRAELQEAGAQALIAHPTDLLAYAS
ncbi:MAG: HAD family hydrolase [Planctomycetes bacterium]|nr:HAD family hydrolase [Planctomycetota bacterium]